MAKTRKLALMALFVAIALTIFMIESQLPPIAPIPGVKLGLANVVTLTAMLILGRKEAGAILAVRILMGAVFAGSPASLLYSAAGGFLAYLVMCLTVKRFEEKQLWIVSALAGVAHNAGQILVAMAMLETSRLAWYLPVLWISGIVAGLVIGLLSKEVVRRLPTI